jgi:histone H3/H4
MENYLREFSVQHINMNEANELAKAATRKTTLPPDVFLQTLEDSSVKTIEPEPRTVNVILGED